MWEQQQQQQEEGIKSDPEKIIAKEMFKELIEFHLWFGFH